MDFTPIVISKGCEDDVEEGEILDEEGPANDLGSLIESSVSVPDDVQEAGVSRIRTANSGPAKANSDFDAVVGNIAKTSLTASELPTMFEILDSERPPASAGLGDGSPKER
ncbi:unnamed protein product [Eruca vesicaria subsp. sativa]|uniref:Uncharacterized protein n=1 Tax=Eruca vesicaria subsp. sativa TaxID=29727 RepID=A0ABC8IMM7_ERUVS|nr:unnamed protein product [Eruca vesicaria subsp. sativa]